MGVRRPATSCVAGRSLIQLRSRQQLPRPDADSGGTDGRRVIARPKSAIWACRRAPRRAPRRSESIYSRQSESRKSLANASRQRRSEFERAARSGTLRAPSTTTPPKPAEATLGFSSTERRLTTLRARRYSSDQKKRLFQISYT